MLERPIFVIGVGRSGTTLLQSMLNSHKKIAFPPETHFFRYYISNPFFNRRRIKNDWKYLKKSLMKDKYLSNLDVDLEDIINECFHDGNLSLESIYKIILTKYMQLKNKSLIGDKDPKNIENLRDIKHIFPKAYIIHIIRDPRDVLLSRMKAEWSKNKNFILHILAYRVQFYFGTKYGKGLFKKNYYEILYEDLITNPKRELRKITNFLGLRYDANMLDYYLKSQEIISDEEINWKKNCLKPIISSNKNKWEKELSRRKVYLVERICNEVFQKFDYYKRSKYSEKIGFIFKIYSEILFLLINVLEKFYKLYINLKFILNVYYNWKVKKKFSYEN